MPTVAMTPLTEKQIQAASLVSKGHMTYAAIARELGITIKELEFYRRKPEFIAFVENQRDLMVAEAHQIGIANKEVRINMMQELLQRCYQVIAERSVDPEMLKIPGGSSGLLVKNFKSVGYGRDVEIVETYTFDKALLSEMRELLKQTSMETGQWVEKSQSQHEIVRREYVGIDMDKV